jgi:hemoglobin
MTISPDGMINAVGGGAGLKLIVDNFYARLWADPELKGYFEGIDKEALKRHQQLFLSYALGGQPEGTYPGQTLRQAHTGLNITNEAFDKVARHLRLTLEELDVDRPLIMLIAGYVEAKRSQVVMQTGPAFAMH